MEKRKQSARNAVQAGKVPRVALERRNETCRRVHAAQHLGEIVVETADAALGGRMPPAAVVRRGLVRGMGCEVCQANLLGEEQENNAAQM